MPTLVQEKPFIRLSYDEMEAYIQIPAPGEDEEYTVSLLLQALEEKGINTGIDEDKLSRMISERAYNKDILVAKGIRPIDGIDGYYEYFFNANVDKAPKVLPDGSVDYWSVHSIESVVEGQTIAVYHPAEEGTDGKTVKGKVILAKRSREQLPIKGKGFERRDDNITYTALMDGKIERQNDRIVILPVHELSGNADSTGGNIDFRGDVVIHGNVESGVVIKSTGSITIDGVVEACSLEAGKDIILRSGMMGGNRAFVKTKGNITAKFFEFTNIECEGTIQADVLMECNVSCQKKLILNGPRGSIIGGTVKAIQGIEVSSIGNDVEKKTEVFVGAGIEVYSRLRVLDKKIQATRDNLDKIEGGLKQFEMLEAERGVSYANDPRRVALLRVKIKDTASLANDESEARRLRQLVDSSAGACVSVLKEAFPGVVINIDDVRFTLKNIGKSIEFYKLPGKIATRPCYQGIE